MKNMIKVTWSFTCVSLPQHTNNLGHSGIEYEEDINDVIDIVVIVEVGKLATNSTLTLLFNISYHIISIAAASIH